MGAVGAPSLHTRPHPTRPCPPGAQLRQACKKQPAKGLRPGTCIHLLQGEGNSHRRPVLPWAQQQTSRPVAADPGASGAGLDATEHLVHVIGDYLLGHPGLGDLRWGGGGCPCGSACVIPAFARLLDCCKQAASRKPLRAENTNSAAASASPAMGMPQPQIPCMHVPAADIAPNRTTRTWHWKRGSAAHQACDLSTLWQDVG